MFTGWLKIACDTKIIKSRQIYLPSFKSYCYYFLNKIKSYDTTHSLSFIMHPLLNIGLSKALHIYRSCAIRIQFLLSTFIRSSVHLAYPRCLPTYIATTLEPFYPSLRTMFPGHCHFSLAMRWAMSLTLVLLHISSDSMSEYLNQSHREAPSIGLSITL